MNDDFEKRLRVVETEQAVHNERWEVTEKTLASMGANIEKITEVVTTAKGAAKMGWAIIIAVAAVVAFVVNLVAGLFGGK